MSIFTLLFGIFRQGGLVEALREGRALRGFVISAIVLSILGSALYGFAMGIGLGIETAIKDTIKLGLMAALGLLLSIPIFIVAYRLLGRQERPAQVAAVPLTLVATVAIILAVTAPVVFMLSILAGYSPEAVYIHIVIVDLAVIVGLYLAGTLLYHAFPERKGLVIPNVVGFAMLAVILVVLMSFLGPLLVPSATFSAGTDRLMDGLGIGVEDKVNRALKAAAAAERVTYAFQTTNENGDIMREYEVIRVGDDYLIDVKAHLLPGESFHSAVRLWVLDGEVYTDLTGRVSRVDRAEVQSVLDAALPPGVFTLPPEYDGANWRAYEGRTHYTAAGTTASAKKAELLLETATGRLTKLTLGSAERGLHAEIRVTGLQTTELDRAGLVAGLNQAIVLSAVDRSDAAMQDYAQEDGFFVLRYPHTWRSGTWNTTQRRVDFSSQRTIADGGASLTLSVFDLAENKGPRQYAEDLADSLELQTEYRQISAGVTTVRGESAGVVEYLEDRLVKGMIETTHHIEYIFVGSLGRYHLDFSALARRVEEHRPLFEQMASEFTYLKAGLW